MPERGMPGVEKAGRGGLEIAVLGVSLAGAE